MAERTKLVARWLQSVLPLRAISGLLLALSMVVIAPPAAAQSASTGLVAPASVTARDRPWDAGGTVVVEWTEVPGADSYQVFRSLSADETKAATRAARVRMVAAFERLQLLELVPETDEALLTPAERRARVRPQVEAYADELRRREASEEQVPWSPRWALVDVVIDGATSTEISELTDGDEYRFRVIALDAEGRVSDPVATAEAVSPRRQLFDGKRGWLLVITVVLCGSVLAFIVAARTGMPLKVRQIAGLAAVDEAVGRATEMGRSVLFIPGIQDMNDIQTVAGITILSRVAQTAAEYDARVEVPTARSLVMTAAREAVQASFLSAGRPDSFNPDLIYYVTDEQFGFVAYLSGMMVREKPAACFYMGCFFAESLILAETGNSIGAIQIAGTAQPAQLPFFVAACDYTLIGEEFFAASAYLSGEPDQLGSLKGQDIGKVIVAAFIVIGSTLLTIAQLTGNERLMAVVDYIRESVLS